MLRLVADDEHLLEIHFRDRTAEPEKPNEVLRRTRAQLDAYFRGKLTQFDLPIRFAGTEFQRHAWQALRGIPFGETISYKRQAELIGSVPRAVGLANGRNPVSIIVPCHRVIGADGSLVGYGGGLDRKRRLLQFEALVREFGPQEFQ
jgi:methylated-DNA-[protein]-cysteine S-methyltransferase